MIKIFTTTVTCNVFGFLQNLKKCIKNGFKKHEILHTHHMCNADRQYNCMTWEYEILQETGWDWNTDTHGLDF